MGTWPKPVRVKKVVKHSRNVGIEKFPTEKLPMLLEGAKITIDRCPFCHRKTRLLREEEILLRFYKSKTLFIYLFISESFVKYSHSKCKFLKE